MCGRFTRNYTWAQLHALYSLSTPPASNLQPRFNICPTTTIDAVIERDGKRELVPMRWGLIPAWWSKPLKEANKLASFNARIETVTTKPFFREAFKRNRCLIPASGYYEWQEVEDGKQPHYFTRADGDPVTIAGLWDEWKDRDTGETLRSCTMLIGPPNAMVAEVHDRQPIILERHNFGTWLDAQNGLSALAPTPDATLVRHAVSRRVNSWRADDEDAALLERVAI